MKKKIPYVTLYLFILLFSSFIYAQEQAALNFDGNNDYIQTDYAGILGNTARTVEAWVLTGSGNNEQIITTWGTESTNGGRFTFRLNDAGGAGNDVIRIENKGGGINGTITINDGNWHHVAVTYDPSAADKYKLYVDGELDIASNISQALNTIQDTNLIIGRRINGSLGGYFDGNIDEVRVWNYARTQEDIQNSMNIAPCSTAEGLVFYLDFNEGIPNDDNTVLTSVEDNINNYTGTLNNFELTGTSSNFVEGQTIASGEIDNTITIANNTLIANESGALYQWIDCSSVNPYIDGATDQTYAPIEDGSYAVRITKGDCVAFADCIDFEVTCPHPTDVTLINISDDSVIVYWSEAGEAQEWNVAYGEAGFDPSLSEGTVINTDNPDMIEHINGLTPETSYDVYVQSVCGGDDGASNWGYPVNFTTVPVSCFTPEDLTVFNITSNSAEVHWTETGEAGQWNILYGVVGFDPETEGEMETIFDNPTAITGLESQLSYDIYLQSACDEDDVSNWQGPITFTTDELGLSSQNFEAFNFYPNPAQNEVTLTAGSNTIQTIVIYNLVGQKVIEETPHTSNKKIDVSKLPSGAYLMQVSIQGNQKVFKLVKK